MRELNECKTEIFRRSEQKIKKRKKQRSSVIAFCIMLFISLTVLWVTDFTELSSEKYKDNEAPHITRPDTTVKPNPPPPEATLSIVSAQITYPNNINNEAITLSQQDKIYGLYSFITDLFISAKEDTFLSGSSELNDGDNEGVNCGGNGNAARYTVRFIFSNGIEKEYILINDMLYDNSKNIIKLSEAQLTELLGTIDTNNLKE